MNPQALGKSSLLRILLPLVAVLVVLYFTVRQADALLDRALHAALGEHQSDFESVWFDWSGNVTAKHVVLRPNDLGQAAELRFERVWLETPGWRFFLMNLFDRSLAKARVARVHLVLDGATVVDGLEAMVPELGPIGPASAAAFESAGCGTPAVYSRDDLVAMGLSPGKTSLEIDHRLEGDALSVSIALATQGSSRTQLDRAGRLDAARDSLLGERAMPRIESERWHVRDEGFMAARNRHCAAQDGITPRETLERHVDALGRLMQRAGLAVDENAYAFYRRFARSGGEMAFGGAYQPPLSAEESLDSRDDGRALARMNATLERDTRAVPIVWRVTPVADDVPAGPDPAPAEPAPVTVTPPPEPVVPPPAAEPEPVATPEPEPVATPPAVVETPPAPEPAVPAPEPATAPVQAPPAAKIPRPEMVGGLRIVQRAPPPVRRDSLEFDDLARHRGRQVRLWTVHNPPRTVEIMDASGDEVRVRVKLGGGQAEYTVKREGFLRAALIR